MRTIDYLFGKKPATRLAKAVFYVAWFSMLPDFFNVNWLGINWPSISLTLMLSAFFLTGFFITFANKETLIDYCGPTTRLGREISSPIKGKHTSASMRVIGVFFMLGTCYIAYDTFHRSAYNGSTTTRSSK